MREPDQIEALLAETETPYVTGHLLDVDGGFDAAGMPFELEGA